MIKLDLTEQQRQELISAVQGALANIRMEIDDTDNEEYRVMLEERWQVMAGVLERLVRTRDITVSL